MRQPEVVDVDDDDTAGFALVGVRIGDRDMTNSATIERPAVLTIAQTVRSRTDRRVEEST